MQGNPWNPIVIMKTKNIKIATAIHAKLKRAAKIRETKIGLLAARIIADGLKTNAKP